MMLKIMARLLTGCSNVKHAAQDWWRRERVAERLQQTTRRMATVTRTTGSNAVDNARRTFDRVRARIVQREPQGGQEYGRKAARRNANPEPFHQPLQTITHTPSYLKLCRGPGPAPSTGKKHRFWEGYKRRGGAIEQGREALLPENNETVTNTTTGGKLIAPKPPFSPKELEDYLMLAIHSSELDDQLKAVPLQDPTKKTIEATKQCNKPKNRYKNNVPYDETRVVLEEQGTEDYINASYIASYQDRRRFIAAQGPKSVYSRTVEDFWLMVWQQRTNVIVMVANLVEGGREKVAQYWPSTLDTTEDYGGVKVKLQKETKYMGYTVRQLLVTLEAYSREVLQFQYTSWPDHFVPNLPMSAAQMISHMCRYRWSGPPVIHCSAGLGRTGTILLVLVLLDSLLDSGRCYPQEVLHMLRRCRANLLDNKFQYKFAHQVLLELLFGERTAFTVEKLCDTGYLTSMTHRLRQEFLELKTFPTGLTYDWARKYPPSLNRNNNILPADGRQVTLISPEGQTDQYVNAVRVRGLGLVESFVVTEHPKVETMGRAWRLACTARPSAWVFLHDHRGQAEKGFPPVLPQVDHGELEGVTVNVARRAEGPYYDEVSVSVSQGVAAEPHKLEVLQFKHWPSLKDVPDQMDALFILMNRILEFRRAKPFNIIMVTCSDGYTASGLVVTLLRLFEEMELTQRTSVYRNALSVLFFRPQFIISERQYLFLHEAASTYQQKRVRERRQRQAAEQQKKEQARRTENTAAQKERKEAPNCAAPSVPAKAPFNNNERETRGNTMPGEQQPQEVLRQAARSQYRSQEMINRPLVRSQHISQELRSQAVRSQCGFEELERLAVKRGQCGSQEYLDRQSVRQISEREIPENRMMAGQQRQGTAPLSSRSQEPEHQAVRKMPSGTQETQQQTVRQGSGRERLETERLAVNKSQYGTLERERQTVTKSHNEARGQQRVVAAADTGRDGGMRGVAIDPPSRKSRDQRREREAGNSSENGQLRGKQKVKKTNSLGSEGKKAEASHYEYVWPNKKPQDYENIWDSK